MNSEIEEPKEDLSSSPLYSEDLAPVPLSKRTWNTWHLAALWVGMAVCIPTYILASYMIKSGLSWYSALIIICIANIIITVPMALNGHAGVKYGVPFPVLGRAAFGTNGIHIASLMRAIVACGWFGVQTWIGGLAFYAIWNALTGSQGELDLNFGKFLSFGLFWLVNMYFIWKGTESIKWLEEFSAPILILVGVALIGWGAYTSGGFGLVLEQSKQLEKPSADFSYDKTQDKFYLKINPLQNSDGQIKATHYQVSFPNEKGILKSDWKQIENTDAAVSVNEIFPEAIHPGLKTIQLQLSKHPQETQEKIIYSSKINVDLKNSTDESHAGGIGQIWNHLLWLTAMVGFWATMSISIADITRYAVSQKAQVLGQFMGLPGTMVLYSFVGVFVTCAAVINFNDILISDDAPWDPVSLLSRFENPAVVIFSQIAMIIATLSTNIAANVIAPANAFSNLFPKKLSFKGGGVVTGIIGILICPWWMLDEISGILIFISGLLGPVLGILVCDYFAIRKKNIVLVELYKTDGVYSYGGTGFNSAAIISLVVGISSALIGYWVPALGFLYNLSWFTGFGISFIVYFLLMKKRISATD